MIHYLGNKIQIITGFPLETMEARKQRNYILKILRKNICYTYTRIHISQLKNL